MLEGDGQADALSKVEITPAMVEVGIDRLMDLWGVVASSYLVEQVFQAMASASVACPPMCGPAKSECS